MQALRFHEHGSALDVLRLEEAGVPQPAAGQIRIAVQACGLTPADWALCTGLFAGQLPRGIGLEVSGTVTAAGPGVTGVQAGDAVFGPAPYAGPTAGAAGEAVLDVWAPRPDGLSPADAAALPMAVETACRALGELGVHAGLSGTVLIHGAGSTVGYAAAQIALERGARVVATAGATYAAALEQLGARVTGYGDGMAGRVRGIAGGPVDLALDAAPSGGGAMADLVAVTGDPGRVVTVSDFDGAREHGARVSFGAGGETEAGDRSEVLAHYGRLAAAGRFRIPVARVFPLAGWREAAALSLTGHAHGKVVLRIG